MKTKTTFYRQLSVEQRKQVKKRMLEVMSLRKEQMLLFENIFIEPQRKILVSGQSVLKNEFPIEHFLLLEKRWNEFLSEFNKVRMKNGCAKRIYD